MEPAQVEPWNVSPPECGFLEYVPLPIEVFLLGVAQLLFFFLLLAIEYLLVYGPVEHCDSVQVV